MPIEASADHSAGFILRKGILFGCFIQKKKKQLLITHLFAQDTKKKNLLDPPPKSWETTYATISVLNSQETLTRRLTLPVRKEKDIDAVLPFQLESLVPYSLEETVYDRILLFDQGDKTLLCAQATSKTSVKSHLEKLRPFHLQPDFITSSATALAQFTHFANPQKEGQISLYLDGADSFIITSTGGKLFASHPIPSNEELKKVYLSLKSRTPFALSPTCFVTGPNRCQPLDIPTTFPKHPDWDKFALAIGAAVGQATTPKHLVNFRIQEFSHPNPWKRFLRPLTLYGSATLTLTLAFFIFGKSYLNYQTDHLLEQFARTQKKETLTEVTSMSLEQLESALYQWKQEVQKQPNLFALHPNIPTVSDLLAWLATHPQVVYDTEKEKIQITSLHYNLVKRPESKKKNDPYQVKVELEFKTATPKLAREFHDALITDTTLVDAKKEIKWSTNRGAYKASFYLIDKTVYP